MFYPSALQYFSALQRLSFHWRQRRGVIGFCVLTLFCSGGTPIPTDALAGNQTQYIVDGLALGDPVAPKSATYREYQCRPSEQFESFIWCRRRRTENGKFGEFTSVNSILHSSNGATAYISRYIEPAYFAVGDVDREIKRLSQRFGTAPHILQSPQRSGSPLGVIAYWGDVKLTPLDSRSLAQLAAGQSVAKGMLFDFLGNFGDSAREGFPIFQLGGASGYVWGAHFDENGKGSLRMTAIDASQFSVPSSVAHGGDSTTPPPETRRSVSPGDTPSPAPQPGVRLWSGSGFFVSQEGHVLTNNHVIEKCTSIRVFVNQAEPVEAREIASDSTNDLALLSTGLKPTHVAAPRSGSRLGEFVAAFGYPHADVLATSGNFTQGSVTALAGMGDDSRYLQISTPVQAGNSGGPLLDQNGNLVGIVTSKLNALKMAQASGDLPQNVNFALKASIIASFLDINGIKYTPGSATSALKPEEIADQAKAMSVFILCK
jgi:S1-C subfamily serine protease